MILTYEGEPVILGPTPCQGCRQPVAWLGVTWLDPQGPHACGPAVGEGWEPQLLVVTSEGPGRVARALSTPATEAGPSMAQSQGSRQAPTTARAD